LCECSEVRIEAKLDALPLDEGVPEVAVATGVDPLELAAGAGEDYELLFTAAGAVSAAVEHAGEECGSRVTWIGNVSAAAADGDAAVTLLDETGRPRRLAGWDHLRRGRERKAAPPGRASR
jgi:thiamine-monophosphate kinase